MSKRKTDTRKIVRLLHLILGTALNIQYSLSAEIKHKEPFSRFFQSIFYTFSKQ